MYSFLTFRHVLQCTINWLWPTMFRRPQEIWSCEPTMTWLNSDIIQSTGSISCWIAVSWDILPWLNWRVFVNNSNSVGNKHMKSARTVVYETSYSFTVSPITTGHVFLLHFWLISATTGLPSISDTISHRRNALFGHVARLSDDVPAHKALNCHINLLPGRPPSSQWRRRPGRPRSRWVDQLQTDNNIPPADLWRRAVNRGHRGATLRPLSEQW